MRKIMKIDVNELKEILQNVYGKRLTIKGVEIADSDNQYNPKYKTVDVGGILTIHVEIDK